MPLEWLTMAGGALIDSTPAVPPETRDPLLWPLSGASFWNTPKGDGASLDALSGTMALELRSVGATVNYGTYTTPVNVGQAADAPVTLREVAAGTWKPSVGEHVIAHAPAAIALAGDMAMATVAYNSSGAIGFTYNGSAWTPDGFMALVDATTGVVTESYKTCWDSTGSPSRVLLCRAGTVHSWDMKSGDSEVSGARASRLPFLAGLIRSWEVTKAASDPLHAIRHALSMAVNRSQLLNPNSDAAYVTPGYQWPAAGRDADGTTTYTGTIRMGTQFFLDPTYDFTTLGLSAEGLALAYALRDYGAYVTDASSWVTLYMEQGTSSAAALRMKSDWLTLVNHMVPVLNNSVTNPGGPGARVRPPAPAFQ